MSASTLTPAAADRKAAGKRLRDTVPLKAQGVWKRGQRRIDPIQVLLDQDEARLQVLVPERHRRMGLSAFAFYRGSAAVMACDLATTPSTEIMVQANGDAHLSNYGLFATPERRTVFDLNDFDETLSGPWEWDVKRLATSFVLAARDNCRTRCPGWRDSDGARLAETAAKAYRTQLLSFAKQSALDVWYASEPVELIKQQAPTKADRKALDQVAAAAAKKTSAAAVKKLTKVGGDGSRRFKYIVDVKKGDIVVPLRHLEEFLDSKLVRAGADQSLRGLLDPDGIHKQVSENLRGFLDSTSADRRHLLGHFEIKDIALKVVGVGSVGTRCFAVLCEGVDHGEPLMLQVKQAMDPVLALAGRPCDYTDQGRRVVEGQRLIQSASDIFLGYSSSANEQFYYWRQLADGKGSVVIDELDPSGAGAYARLCGWALAHAHARSGDSISIAGYLGKSTDFDKAIRKFALSYADQAELDYQAWVQGIKSGRVSTDAAAAREVMSTGR